MVNLTTVSEALKVLYINPIREFVNMQADPFAARILQTSDNITGYQKIVRAVQIGANGGAGAGTETGILPQAGENLYKQFESDTKNLYGTISISDKVMKSATGADAGSFINALQRDVDTLVKTLKWSVARQIYGDGTGILVKLGTASSGATELTIQTGSNSRNLLPGLSVDVYNAAGTKVSSNAAVTRIVDVNHSTGKVKIDTALTGNVTAGGYITMQGSKDLELTGLGKIFNPTTFTELYGLTRSNYSWMNPTVNSAFGEITEWGLQDAINQIEDTYDVSINHIAAGNKAYNSYMKLLNSRRAINDTMTLEGGFKALIFNGRPVTRNKFLDDTTIDLYDTSLFTIDQIADWEWLDDDVHGILQRNARYATYEGSIAKYCDLMCRLPGGIARLSGVTDPSATKVAVDGTVTTVSGS